MVRELIEMNKRLQAQTEMLHETLIKTVHQVTIALDKMTNAQVELTKHLAPVVEAAAATVSAARGRGFASIADELQAVMDVMPEQGNSLETVLSSPVVIGAAGMLQKFMSEAAKNAAASAAGVGGHSENEAARQARRFLKLQAERERREAQQGA